MSPRESSSPPEQDGPGQDGPGQDRPAPTAPDHRLSVAPMMEWTDRHARFFLRQITRHTCLYTEMVTARAILHGDRSRLLDFDPIEHPLALQLGGSDPGELREAAIIGRDWGYDEVNLNVGCPSDRVQTGRFGACLMAEPERVAACLSAMADSGLPVTVKCRIGIDDRDSYEDLVRFVAIVRQSGVRCFIIHARKAFLQGLSPKENRTIPPLHPERVIRLKAETPDLEIVLNGGILSLEAAERALCDVDGVMIGRAAYQTPWILAEADRRVFSDLTCPVPDRAKIVATMADYAGRVIEAGGRLQDVARHMLGLFQGEPGARAWRRHLSENAPKPGASPEVLLEAALKPCRQANPGTVQGAAGVGAATGH